MRGSFLRAAVSGFALHGHGAEIREDNDHVGSGFVLEKAGEAQLTGDGNGVVIYNRVRDAVVR
ncbi:hypothetical protein DEI98_12840 [Curtobacterium sp. MCLR17_034]|nr:hypothetical protein DEI98_12840 [Curtobacterium sp. MCLR17_034]